MISCAVAIVPMAKPSFIRAEQPLAPDLASDRTVGGGGATSRRRDIVFVVNPRGLSQFYSLDYIFDTHKHRSKTCAFTHTECISFIYDSLLRLKSC